MFLTLTAMGSKMFIVQSASVVCRLADANGRTFLYLAARLNSIYAEAVAKLLLRHGANEKVRDSASKLGYSYSYNRKDVLFIRTTFSSGSKSAVVYVLTDRLKDRLTKRETD